MALSNLDTQGDILPKNPASGGGGGSVASVTAGDTTITVGGTAADPTIIVGTLVPGSNGVPTIAAGDATITIGGTATARTVAVTAATFALVGTTMTAGAGLTGGGSLAANRTFDIGAGSGITVNADSIQVDSTVVALAATTISAGTGLTGGGSLASNRTISLDLTAADAWTAAHTWSTTTFPIQSTITDSGAATQLEAARFRHHSSTNATAGISSYISLWASNAVQTDREMARIHGLMHTVTDTGEASTILFQTMSAGALITSGHWRGTSFFSASALGIGTVVVATGVSTTQWQLSTSSSMWQYNNSLTTNGGHLFIGSANTSGARQFFVITPSANTGSTAGTEVQKFEYQTYTHQFASNTAVTSQREFCIKAPTYAFASATGTISTAATLYIDQGPIVGTNAAITKSHPLWIDAGLPRIDSTTANGTTATILGSVGPAGANTTVQEWLTIDINGTTRFIPCF